MKSRTRKISLSLPHYILSRSLFQLSHFLPLSLSLFLNVRFKNEDCSTRLNFLLGDPKLKQRWEQTEDAWGKLGSGYYNYEEKVYGTAYTCLARPYLRMLRLYWIVVPICGNWSLIWSILRLVTKSPLVSATRNRVWGVFDTNTAERLSNLLINKDNKKIQSIISN